MKFRTKAFSAFFVERIRQRQPHLASVGGAMRRNHRLGFADAGAKFSDGVGREQLHRHLALRRAALK